MAPELTTAAFCCRMPARFSDTGSGLVTLNGTGINGEGIRIENGASASSATGDVSVTVTDSDLSTGSEDGTAQILGRTVTLTAVGATADIGPGAIGSGNRVEIGATNLTGSTVGGDFRVSDVTGDVTISSIAAATGDVELQSAGNLFGATDDATADITAANLTLIAASDIRSDDAADASLDVVLSGSISATTTAGDIFIDSIGDLNVDRVTAGGSSTVQLDSTAAITDVRIGEDTGNHNIAADSAALLAATGIGAADDIDLLVTTVAFRNTTSGAVNLIDVAGGLAVDDAASLTESLAVAGGSVTAASPLTIAHDVTTNAAMSFTAGDSATTGDNLTINAGATVLLDSAIAAALTFTAGDDIILNSDGTARIATAGAAHTVNIVADNEGNADADRGSISQTGTDITVAASTGTQTLNLTASDGIGSGNAIRTTVDTLSAVNTDTGDIDINEANAIDLLDLDTDDGAITVIAGGQITATDVNSSNMDADSNDISLTSTGAGIQVLDVNSGSSGDVTLDAQGGSITEGGTAAVDLVADVLTATASASITLDTTIASLDATAAGDVDIDETDAITLADVSTSTDSVTVDAGGLITATLVSATGADGNVSLNSTAGGILAAAVSTTDGDISLTADSSSITVDAGGSVIAGGAGQNVSLATTTSGDIVLTGTTTADNDTVTISSAGNINGSGLVTADTVDFDAASGIGNSTVVELAAANIAADSLTDVLDINNTLGTTTSVMSLTTVAGTINFDQTGGGDLTVDGGVTSGSAGTNGGDITITSANGLTVNAVVSSAGNGATGGTLTASGATINASPVLGAGSIVLSGGSVDTVIGAALNNAGDLNLTAARDVIINAVVTTTAGGNITVTADTDDATNSDASGNAFGGVFIAAAGQLNSAGTVIVIGSDLLNGGAAAATTESIQIDADGANNQILAAGNITLQDGTAAPAAADIVINGQVTSTAGNIEVSAAAEIHTATTIEATAGNIDFNDAAVLTGATTITAGTNATFDSTTDGGFDLTLDVDGAATFTGTVGGTTPLGDGDGAAISINGDGTTEFVSTVGTASGIVQADNAAAVTFRDDVTTAAGNTGSTFNSNVVLDGLTFASGGEVMFGNANTDAVTSSTAPVIVTTAAANANVTFNAATTVGTDLTVSVGSGNITVNAVVDGNSNVIYNSAGTTDINAEIGGTTAVASLTTDAPGTTTLAADVSAQGGTITINDPLVLNADTTLTDSGASGIFLNNTVNSDGTARDLTLTTTNAASTIDIGDAATDIIGGTSTLDQLIVNAAGTLSQTSEIAGAAGLTYDTTGAITITGTTSVAGNIDIESDDTIGISNTIATTSGGTIDIDADGLTTLSAAADITADGAVTFGGAKTGGLSTAADITTTNEDITFNQAVTLTGTVSLDTDTGAGDVTFAATDGTVDGTHDLNIAAGTGNVEFDAVVGGTTALDDINVTSANAINFDAAITAATVTANGTTVDGSGLVTATTIDLDAVNGIGATTPLQLSAGTLDATNTTSGVIHINEADTVAVGVIDNGTRDVTLNAGGAITDNNAATTNVVAGVFTVDAAGGIDLDTDITSLDASTSAAGNININEANAIALTDVDTTAGNITVNAAGTITITDVEAGGAGANVNLTTTGGGNVEVSGSATATDDTITIDSDGAILGDADAAADLIAANLDLTAESGIGVGQPLETTADNLTFNNTAGAVQIVNSQSLMVTSGMTVCDIELCVTAGDLTLVGNLSAGSNTIRLQSDAGNVNQTGGSIAAMDLGVRANTGITLGQNTNNVDTFAATTASGNILFNEADGFTVATVSAGDCFIATTGVTTAGTGNITLNALGGNLTINNVITATTGDIDVDADVGTVDINAAVSATGGNIDITGDDVTQDADISTTAAGTIGVTADVGAITMGDGTATSSNTGTITFDAATNVVVSQLAATAGAVNVTANVGDITDNLSGEGAGNENISGTTATLTASGNIGGTDDIDTAVATVDVSSTVSGSIDIAETDAVNLSDVDTADGAINITSGGTMTATDVAAGGSSDINLTTTAGGVEAGIVDATGDQITINSAADITESGSDAAADLIAATIDVTAVSDIGTAGNALEIDADSGAAEGLTADVTGAGIINVADVDELRIQSATTSDGDITVQAAGALSAESVTAGGTGDVSLTTTADNLTVDNVAAVDDDITLNSAAQVLEEGSDATADLTAQNIDVTAVSGIGTAAATIEIDATGSGTAEGLTADVTGAGIIDIADVNSLRIVSATTNSGDITLQSDGAMTVETIASGGAGDVSLTTTADGVSVDSVTAADDQITINSAADITELGSDASADLVATNIDLTSANGIGAAGNALEIDADSGVGEGLTANVTGVGLINLADSDDLQIQSATTTDGDITIGAADILIGVISADTTDDTVTLTSTGGINDTSANPDMTTDITAAAVDLNAATGIGNAAHVDLAAQMISADTTSGDIVLNNDSAMDVTVSSLTTGMGDVTFNQTGGGNVSFGVISATNFELCLGSGDIILTGNIDATDIRLQTDAGLINQTAGAITGTNLGVRATAGITLSQSGNDVTNFAAESTAGSIAFTDSDGFDVDTVTDGSCFDAVVGVTTDDGTGSITLISSNGPIVVNDVVTSASGAIDVDAAGATGSITTDAVISSGGGNIDITAADNSVITNSAVQSTSGNISLTGDNINQNAGIVTGSVGTIDVTADNGDITMATGVATVSANGNITYNATGNATLSQLTTVSGNIDVDANGGTADLNELISSTSGSIDITGDDVTQDANVTTGAAATVDVTAYNGSITMSSGTTTSTDTGDITYDATNSVSVSALNSTSGSLNVTATAGAITDSLIGEAANLTTAAAATLVAATGIGSADDIDTTIGTLQAGNSTSGDIIIQETDGLLIAGTGIVNSADNIEICLTSGDLTLQSDITATGSTVRLQADSGAINQTGGVLTTANLGARAATGITLGQAGNDTSIFAATSTSGDITFNDTNGFTVQTVSVG